MNMDINRPDNKTEITLSLTEDEFKTIILLYGMITGEFEDAHGLTSTWENYSKLTDAADNTGINYDVSSWYLRQD
jgi:hypothetical protein